MDSTNISLLQLRRLDDSISEHRRYLYRLHSRMIQQGFPPADPLRLHVERATAALGVLYREFAPEERQRVERRSPLGR